MKLLLLIAAAALFAVAGGTHASPLPAPAPDPSAPAISPGCPADAVRWVIAGKRMCLPAGPFAPKPPAGWKR